MSFVKIGDKKIFSKIFEKNPKGGPFYVKKFFVTDSAQISCVKSLGHKDFKFWISSKSETKKFFFSKGGTLWCFSRNRDFENQKNVKGPDLWKKFFFSSLILMKLKIWNPYGLRISHMKFERNRSRKFFDIYLGLGSKYQGRPLMKRLF